MQYGSCISAVAVSGTTTYKSTVLRISKAIPADASTPSLSFITQHTGTATGTLSMEVSNLDDATYEAAVAAASGADRNAKEAANTTGWVAHDLLPTATIPIASPESNDLNLSAFCYARARLIYVNTTNTGTISAQFCVG